MTKTTESMWLVRTAYDERLFIDELAAYREAFHARARDVRRVTVARYRGDNDQQVLVLSELYREEDFVEVSARFFHADNGYLVYEACEPAGEELQVEWFFRDVADGNVDLSPPIPF